MGIPIAFAVDDNYVLPLIVAIQSIVLSKSEDTKIDVHIFYNSLTDDNIELLKKIWLKDESVVINFVCVKDMLKKVNFYPTASFPIETYYRLLVPGILNQYKKIIYIDADLYVDNDIKQLYDIDLGDSIFAGVGKGENLNAGVMLIDTQNFNSFNVLQKGVSYFDEHKHLKFPDQEALINICKDRILCISPKFNFLVQGEDEYENNFLRNNFSIENKNQIVIYHFANWAKPWLKWCVLANKWWEIASTLPNSIFDMIVQYSKRSIGLLATKVGKNPEKAKQIQKLVVKYGHKKWRTGRADRIENFKNDVKEVKKEKGLLYCVLYYIKHFYEAYFGEI